MESYRGNLKMDFEKRIIETVKNNLEKKCEVNMESLLVEDLGVDSFNKVMIIAAIEDEFSIEIDEVDFAGIQKVRDIVDKLKLKYPQIAGE